LHSFKKFITKKESRRKFITSAMLFTTGLATLKTPSMKEEKKQLIHHVYFWLKSSGSKEDLSRLLEGLRTLEKIETVRKIHIGVPAETEARGVVDASYSASELLFFDDLAGQKTYQDHPIHKKFVEDCSHLWEKVIVYDSMDV
jgi:hypothetical protein